MKTKTIFSSKTFWFNVLTGLVAFLALVTPDTLDKLGIHGTTQVQVLTVIGLFSTFGNIILRVLTDTSISFNKTTGIPIWLLVFLFAGCNPTSKLVTYAENHCKVNKVQSGNRTFVYYECDALYETENVKKKCDKIELCFDAANAKISGTTICGDSLFDIKTIAKIAFNRK